MEMINISNLLEIKRTNFYSYIHGHSKTMGWEIQLDFKPFEIDKNLILSYEQEKHEHCHLCISGIILNDNEWDKISNIELNYKTQKDAEVSFYFSEHNIVDDFNAVVSHKEKNIFNFEIDFQITLKNIYHDIIYARSHFQTELIYKGIELQKQNFKPVPKDIEEIETVVSEFVDISKYHRPINAFGNICMMEPKYIK